MWIASKAPTKRLLSEKYYAFKSFYLVFIRLIFLLTANDLLNKKFKLKKINLLTS